MLSLMIMMGFGFFFRKRAVLTDGLLSGLSFLLLNLTLPCLVIMATQIDFTKELAAEALMTMGIFIVVIVAGCSIGKLTAGLLRLGALQGRVYNFGMGFANISYMGYPIISMLYGDPGCFYITSATIVFNVMSVTYGYRILCGGRGGFKLKQLFSAASVASVIGFIFFLLSFRIWEPVAVAMRSVGNMTTPVSMIFIGAMLADAKPKEIFLDFRLYAYSLIKLIIVPVCAFFILRLFITNELMLTVITLLIGMPAAAVTAILTKRAEGDTVTASKLVFISTALSCVSLPALLLMQEVMQGRLL